MGNLRETPKKMLGKGGRGTPCDGVASHPKGVAIQSNLFNMDIQWLDCLVEVSLVGAWGRTGGGREGNTL